MLCFVGGAHADMFGGKRVMRTVGFVDLVCMQELICCEDGADVARYMTGLHPNWTRCCMCNI